MKLLSGICLGLVAALCASCVHIEHGITPKTAADNSSAIFFGHFHMTTNSTKGMRVSLWLVDTEKQKNLFLGFDRAQPLQVVKVNPGRYQILGFMVSNWSHEDVGYNNLSQAKSPPGVITPFVAGAGSQIYLGDYLVDGELHGYSEKLRVVGITNSFPASTLEFREKYPKLRMAPAVSLFSLKR